MLKTYTGSCHCGAVRFEADLDLTQPSFRCNCSICRRNRFWPAIAGPEGLRLLAGESELTEYRFNKRVIAHQFCKVCGVQPFAFAKDPKGVDTAAINARCVDGVDVTALNRVPYDGASA